MMLFGWARIYFEQHFPRVDVPAAMGDNTDPALLQHVRQQLASNRGEQETSYPYCGHPEWQDHLDAGCPR